MELIPHASVLVVDDERMIADTLSLILKQQGFVTSTAYSGEGAVERCESFHPDLLISDVMMGTLNGIDAAIQVRQLVPSCKVILISGQAATGDLLENARRHGHEFEILAKPVHPAELMKKIRECLEAPAPKVGGTGDGAGSRSSYA